MTPLLRRNRLMRPRIYLQCPRSWLKGNYSLGNRIWDLQGREYFFLYGKQPPSRTRSRPTTLCCPKCRASAVMVIRRVPPYDPLRRGVGTKIVLFNHHTLTPTNVFATSVEGMYAVPCWPDNMAEGLDCPGRGRQQNVGDRDPQGVHEG